MIPGKTCIGSENIIPICIVTLWQKSLLPPNAKGLKFLELGGGTGEMSRRMRERGIEVTFTDLSAANINRARQYGFESYQIDLNDGLPDFASERFDGVMMLEVIEHIVRAEYLLEEVNRVLKPGGVLILSTPNFAYFQNRLRILAGKLSADEGYHYRFFTVASLVKQLRNADLLVEKSAHTMPAIGINFFWNKLFGQPRFHFQVTEAIAPILANTLVVCARKR